ncbi:hypothetical protein J4Q44_G00290300 [Coregonus suidteri]|uniref:Heme-binding protein 1 n=1 Tax=Coregonus suidteri TaxID=861788 RepID=A0AAN8KXY5_9TELE
MYGTDLSGCQLLSRSNPTGLWYHYQQLLSRSNPTGLWYHYQQLLSRSNPTGLWYHYQQLLSEAPLPASWVLWYHYQQLLSRSNPTGLHSNLHHDATYQQTNGPETTARRHKLALKNDRRFVVHLNTFGFFANGTLDVNVLSLTLPEDNSKHPVGFSLSKSRVNGVLSYTAEETEVCPLSKQNSDEPLFLFLIDTNNLRVNVKSYGDQDSVLTKLKTNKTLNKDSGSRRRRAVEAPEDVKTKKPTNQVGRINGLTLDVQKINGSYSFSFHMVIGQLDEGLYNLNFHYCDNILPGINHPFNLNVEVTEKNPGGYLSAAEIPLPHLYIFMAGVFFIIAMVWVYTLLKHRYSVFKIHWLMAALAFTKSISLVFHSINYHFINTEGHPIEGWAVMYYITHLLKGALLFITLALIGTGWAFVKYILSDKEKKIFMIVLPLQLTSSVVEASSLPVIWSIRHLQEASSTDGKAAMNLEKLKLFRHYYVMIVCYIYFTRIIAILLKVTVPFQWQWCYEFLVEVSTLIFFVLTGYKFRPASNNPYLQLPLDEEDIEIDEVVTESGMLEGVSKVKKTSNGRERQKVSSLTLVVTMEFFSGLVVLALMVSVGAEGGVGPSNNSSFCSESKECLEYELVCKTDEYEVRHYSPTRWVSTDAEAYFMGVGAAMAFRRLFQYITGANNRGLQMEMTAPVLVRIPEETRMWEPAIYTLSFLLPAAYQERPPTPTNDKLYFTEMPSMDVYVRSYGGWMLSVTSRLHAHLLTKELTRVQADYNHTYHYGVGYDSPLKLLNRHNEAPEVTPSQSPGETPSANSSDPQADNPWNNTVEASLEDTPSVNSVDGPTNLNLA